MYKIIIIFLLTHLFSFAQNNAVLDIAKYSNGNLINKYMMYYEDKSNSLDFKQALEKYKNGHFKSNKKNKTSFGFTDSTIWAVLELNNTSIIPIEKAIKIDSAWLDNISLFIFHENKLKKRAIFGDTLLFEQRNNEHRMFYLKHLFEKDKTTILFKVQSQDPIILPIHLFKLDEVYKEEVTLAYFYGLLYGVFIILLIYNVAIFIGLKEISYLFYSFYLSSFFLFNVSYTGHGFKYLWPDNIFLQENMMPIFMYFYILSAIMFTFEFLKLKVYLPRLYKYRHYILLVVLIISSTVLLTQNTRFSVSFALFFISLISIFMLIVGAIAIKHGNKNARFFVPAILIGSGGATISSGITFGILPYSTIFFHSAEIGMLLEMTLLALVLAYNLEIKEKAHNEAIHNASIDYLTKLKNRRFFTNVIKDVWPIMKHDKKLVSIIMIDIDHFKKINDTYGHKVGDKVLVTVSNLLDNRIRKSDILARWGGEEFIIFLPDTNKESANLVAENIRMAIETTQIKIEDKNINITASFGIADSSNKNHTIKEIINSSDNALYLAKEKGRNRVECI